MRIFWQDLGYAIRLIARRPSLTLVTVLTLALGIGGNGAIFSVASSLFLRPLPVSEPDRLVRVFGTAERFPFDVVSYPNLRDIASRTRSFQSMTVHQQAFTAFGLGDATEQVAIELVSGSYFTTLGIIPAAGRALAPSDDALEAGSPVAVVSERWARTRLGGAARALEATIHLNGAPFTVVGVAPREFRGSYDALGTEVWVPLMTYQTVRPRNLKITQRGWGWLAATARLAPGVTPNLAQADVDRVVDGLNTELGAKGDDRLAIRLVTASAMPESMGGLLRSIMLFAGLVAALTLAAACANVANAQLATVLQRQREVAVRLALGASRWRIARQWLTESLVMAALATAAGLLGTLWIRDALVSLRPAQDLANFDPVLVVDWRLLAFAATVMMGVTALFGGLPAMRAARVDISAPLKDDGSTTSVGRRRWWLQAALVSAQVAISMALLVSAGLLIRTVSTSRMFDVGFNTRNLSLASADTGGLGFSPQQTRNYFDDTIARVGALPGVTAVTLGMVVPLSDTRESRGLIIDGYTPTGRSPYVSTPHNVVAPGYFEFMGIPIVSGRPFVATDIDPTAPVVAIVNETMARQYWPDGNPVGRVIRLDPKTPVEVVGVARDISYYTPGEPPRPYVYFPPGPRTTTGSVVFHVRTSGPDPALARALQRELRVGDPRVRVLAGTYDDMRMSVLYPQRAMSSLTLSFGLLVLVLAAVGLYGVMSYVVSSRSREFAVRLALGARPSRLVNGVLRQGLAWCSVGLILGGGLAVMLGRLLQEFLFGVSSRDGVSFAAGIVVLLATGLVAAYLPARRVTRIDPSATLRS